QSGLRGFSLSELLLVVSVIAIIAAIAVPSFSTVNTNRLETATSELLMAARFARSESRRTGVPHGLRKLDGNDVIAVFKMDMSQAPPVETFDVHHPVTRSELYRIDLENDERTRGTSVIAYFRIHADNTVHEAISFDDHGEPIDGVTGKMMGRATGGFLLNNGDHGSVVSLYQLSGRVVAGRIGLANDNPGSVF
ncbi:MAG: prepilin-type N-terminal cleavage/methylation domain-containing protein, partial [Gammaproteobacteria bacterium]|nr:prepilin-type N-terminal cleavage/methylation domain-containing protein [Gammaproteobacteria bacterium]